MTKIKDYRKAIICCLILCCTAAILGPDVSLATIAEDRYYKAEACYKKLRSNANKKKYRHNWLSCIKKFEAVFRHDPSGLWASAGLYMSGKLYQELYKYSGKKSDQKEALDIFKRIVNRFPKSSYKQKAVKAMGTISKLESKKHATSTPKRTNLAKNKYVKAEACYKKLLDNPKKQKYRDNWLSCIEKFQAVYRHDKSGPWAAAALYMSGKLYQELYKHSYTKSDQKKALGVFERIIKHYPKSDYSRKAAGAIQKISPKQIHKAASEQAKVSKNKKKSPGVKAPSKSIPYTKAPSAKNVVKTNCKHPEQKCTTVTGLRFWSNPKYTRIVIDADDEALYEHRLLKKDPSIKKPQRLFIDLINSRLDKEIKKNIPINDNLLSNVRAGQNASDLVRVVVDIKSFESYKIFSLKNPFRIVIDVWGSAVKLAKQTPYTATPGKGKKIGPSAIAKQLALGVRRIIIDPGHGGRDYGAPGYLKGVHEKDIILKIAKRLAKKIREKLKCEVILTRNRDKFLTLEERTAIANTKNADLFISLHANSSRDRRAYGIETYFLNLATDDESIMVAARENATSTKNISDLQAILNDLMQNAKINESSRLAAHVQKSLYGHMKSKYRKIKNKGVKQAPFYVLLGAQMPSILIETSFISHKRECKRLINSKYQDQLCEGIVKGIRNYIKETNPTAFFKQTSSKS